jgi:beta-galactosidase
MLGVCYYPEHWPEDWWAQDARRMRETGISFVRIGEFAWSRYEPKRGQFEWGWLDRAMDILGEAGLKIVLGTPTCTPPKWVVDSNPDMIPVDSEGRQRGFGSRRHYTFSAQSYWNESRRIVEILAKRYGKHPALVGWQTDNEYGCHDTILSWSETDLKAFRQWLRRTYQSTEQLNEAWGNAFWSMDVNDFEEIELPVLAVTEANPAARLDFWRFHSSQVADYDAMQCSIIRAHSPGRWITHNFMGFFNEFDHWPVGANLDLASWDSYPIGFVERFPFAEEERNRWARTSHPDIAPFHHDLYRGVGRGRFWVMEQQPGPVNWAPWNPVPKRGMVRLWTWEALAHGAEVVSYFRWRQAQSAQEQFHAGLNLPGQHEYSQGGKEAAATARELDALGQLPGVERAPVALVYDYAAHWMTKIQPQGADFCFHELAFRWYEAARRLGLDLDIVAPGADLAAYSLVLVPSMPHVSDDAERAFLKTKGTIIYGPRSGSRTRHHAIPANLPPGPLGPHLGMRMLEASSLRPGLSTPVEGAVNGKAIRWREYVEASSTVLARFGDGDPALIGKENQHYLACWPNEQLLTELMAFGARTAGLRGLPLPPAIRLRRRGNLTFAFNYGEDTWDSPVTGKLLLGTQAVRPKDLAIWRDG